MPRTIDGESFTHGYYVTVDKDEVDSNLTDKDVMVDLALLPSVGFWDVVRAAGGDIRVTLSDESTSVPMMLNGINTGTETGTISFKGTLSSSVDTVFLIAWGNATADQPAADAAKGSENVWDNDVVLRMSLYDNVTDSTSNDNHGTEQGGFGYAAGMHGGRAGDFDEAVNSYISVSDSAELKGMSELTVSAFVYDSSDSDDFAGIIAKMDIFNANRQYDLLIDGSTPRRPYCIMYNDVGPTRSSPDPKADASPGLPTGEWHHVAATYNGTTTKFYMDGVLQSQTGTLTSDIDSQNNDVYIGNNRSAADVFWDGMIQEPRIETTDRSAAWLAASVSNMNGNLYALSNAGSGSANSLFSACNF